MPIFRSHLSVDPPDAILSAAKKAKMAKLTDSQRIVLSKAAARGDGVAVVPPKMAKAAAVKIGSSLSGRKLMREIRSKPGMPVWREDADGRSISLVITRAGRDAIGIESAAETGLPVSTKCSAAQRADRHLAGAAPLPGSKQALVIEMLSKKQGATLDALAEATGWLPHTTQAALTGLRKRGFAVERVRRDQGLALPDRE
jgi:Protein of unknown function (DUF3489)